MPVSSKIPRAATVTPAWLFSDAYLSQLVSQWLASTGIIVPADAHDPARSRWAILTALTGSWCRVDRLNAIAHTGRHDVAAPGKASKLVVKDWRGASAAKAWGKANPPSSGRLHTGTRNARVLAALDMSPVRYRVSGTNAHGLLGATSSSMATQITKGIKSLPAECAKHAAKSVFCNLDWLSGKDRLRGADGKWIAITQKQYPGILRALGAEVLRDVLHLQRVLPDTVTNAPTWLHPYLVWWHLNESHIGGGGRRSGQNGEGKAPPDIGIHTPPPSWMAQNA
jgi:hypothetical protein